MTTKSSEAFTRRQMDHIWNRSQNKGILMGILEPVAIYTLILGHPVIAAIIGVAGIASGVSGLIDAGRAANLKEKLS